MKHSRASNAHADDNVSRQKVVSERVRTRAHDSRVNKMSLSPTHFFFFAAFFAAGFFD